jgi:PAS domain S-box-containing protein
VFQCRLIKATRVCAGGDHDGRHELEGRTEVVRVVTSFCALSRRSATDFAIIALDPNGLVTSWNVGAERLIGYAEAEIVGRDGDVIFTREDRAAGAPERERAEARTHGRAEDERWHVRKDGSQFWAPAFLMPLNDGSGFVKIMRNLTERQAWQARPEAREELFRVLATNIPQLVFRTRDDGMRTWGSPQWIAFHRRVLRGQSGLRVASGDPPREDRDVTAAGWLEARRNGEYHVEHRIRRSADGEYRWHQTRAVPVAENGTEGEWVGTSTDVHDLRGLQDRQQVLLAELQHRTRDLLAVVQSLARQTARNSGTVEEFSAELEGRLRALGRVQSLLARVDHGPVELGALIDAELGAHEDSAWEGGKVTVRGRPVLLPANSAQAMALPSMNSRPTQSSTVLSSSNRVACPLSGGSRETATRSPAPFSIGGKPVFQRRLLSRNHYAEVTAAS